MDYLNLKKEILELKLNLLNVQIEKKNCIRFQQYEKAADIRTREKELLKELEDVKNMLIEKQLNFHNKTENLEDFYILISAINEISIFHSPFIHFEEKLEDFSALLLMEYDELWKKKRELTAQHKFKEASEVQSQIIEIGQFMMKYGKG